MRLMGQKSHHIHLFCDGFDRNNYFRGYCEVATAVTRMKTKGKMNRRVISVSFVAIVLIVLISIGQSSNVLPSSDFLGEKAAFNAKGLLGVPYVYGEKGYTDSQFSDATSIKDKGIDCSGLVFWAFNTAAEFTKCPAESDENFPIFFFGANDQWSDTKRIEQLSTPVYDEEDATGAIRAELPQECDLKPGYLLFLDTPDKEHGLGFIDHVGMYEGTDSSGTGWVIHANGAPGKRIVEEVALNDWLNTKYSKSKKYSDYFAGYGRVKFLETELDTIAAVQSAYIGSYQSLLAQEDSIDNVRIELDRIKDSSSALWSVFSGYSGQSSAPIFDYQIVGVTYCISRSEAYDYMVSHSIQESGMQVILSIIDELGLEQSGFCIVLVNYSYSAFGVAESMKYPILCNENGDPYWRSWQLYGKLNKIFSNPSG